MGKVTVAIVRITATLAGVWAVLAIVVPFAMSQYSASGTLQGVGVECLRRARFIALTRPGQQVPSCGSVAEVYQLPFTDLLIDSTFRSLSLLVGAAVLALTLGTLIGVAAALVRRHAFASGGIVGVTALLTAVPAFFVAYFLQIFVIVVGASPTGGRLLPVYGFGYDEHLILPLLSISIPAIAYTAQLTATRMGDVLESDFVTAANAKGLRTSWILGVHVLPHVRPVLLEGLGSGLRVSVASLPIIEYLFQWRGIGQLALDAIGLKDAPALIFCALVLAALFVTLSAVADLSRHRAIYRTA